MDDDRQALPTRVARGLPPIARGCGGGVDRGGSPAGQPEEAGRIRDLVASHNRLHELIAHAAPLSEVLCELVEGIERYEPSVIPCVVLLDRESSTLHPSAGPSLPPHYPASIDGVVIGPSIGACESAAWSGCLTITEGIAEDPRWGPDA